MPTSKRPYQNEFKKYSRSDNLAKKPKSMTRSEELILEKKDRYKDWITFFRQNIHIFAEHYFKIELYPYQKIMLWALQKSTIAYIVASRAVGKSFMIAVFSLCLAVLYPGIKIVVASKTLKQASVILDEKLRVLQDRYPMVAREIKAITVNNNGAVAEFHCGSRIKASVSSENARGGRCNFLILEESRMVPKEALEKVLKPFLEIRKPPYMLKEEYKDDKRWQEDGLIAYITSAWYIGEYWFTYVKSTILRMVNGDDGATFLAFDYLLTVYHDIKTESMIKNEMEDSDPLSVQMEYLNIPSGSSGKSYFPITLFKRDLKVAFYPQKEDNFNIKKNVYDIEKTLGELRFVSVDIATRDNKANDNSIIQCIRATPLRGLGYKRELLYLESHRGEHAGEQAKRIKRIMHDFDANFLVLDIQSAGIGIFDYLSEPTTDDERGLNYDAITVVDGMYINYGILKSETRDDLLKNHTRGIGALPKIFPILASQQMNSDAAIAFRSSLQRNLWRFLIADNNAEEYLLSNSSKNKEYKNSFSKDAEITSFFINPYVQTNLLIGECVNLDRKPVDGVIKLVERSGSYKDRYSAISYANYVISKAFDIDLVKQEETKDDLNALMAVTYF